MEEIRTDNTKTLKNALERIAELEKENAELEQKAELWKKASENNSYKAFQLEKENAKLKEKLKPENCLKFLAKGGYVKFTNDQLTKTKEILRSLYFIIQSRIDYANNIEISDEMWRAKQLLQE